MEKGKLRKPTKRQVERFLLHSFIIVLGNAITAAGTGLFIEPYDFAMGGTTGIGFFMRHILPASAISEWVAVITVYVANIVLFVLGAVLLGKKFALSTLAGTLLYPTFLALFKLVPMPVFEDRFLASMCGALLFGLGIGIVIRVGASTGGTDIPPLILHKFFNLPVSVTLWVLDMAIVALQIIGAPSAECILYGIVITLVSSIVIDKVAPIGMKRTQVQIISAKHEEIRAMILNEISRGVTVLYGETGYLRNEARVLLTVISHREIVKLKTKVQAIDPEAFMTISVVSEVHGRGFYSEGVDFLIPKEEDEPILKRNKPNKEKK